MTKKVFERYKRFVYEKGNEVVQGWIDVHDDCPDLKEIERIGVAGIHFADIGNELIVDSYFVLQPNSRQKIDYVRKIHFKWIRKCHIYGMYKWVDKGGKREGKLNWVLKNLKSDEI